MATVAERVQKGIELLDANEPEWRDSVAGKRIDVGSDDNDVLTLVFGDFMDAHCDLDFGEDEIGDCLCWTFGFDGPDTYTLSKEWTRRLTEPQP